MADPPRLSPWPILLQNVQRHLRRLHFANPYDESEYYIWIITILHFAFPPEIPFLFGVWPQPSLPLPVALVESIGDNSTSDSNDDIDSNDDANSDVSLDENDENDHANLPSNPVGNVELSIEHIPQTTANVFTTLHGYPALQGQGRGRGRSVPDFIVDQEHLNRRHYVFFCEVKKSLKLVGRDLEQILKYSNHLRAVHNVPGQDLTNVALMLVAGGRAITWDFDDLRLEVPTLPEILARPFVLAHEDAFLDELARIRSGAPYPDIPHVDDGPDPLGLLYSPMSVDN